MSDESKDCVTKSKLTKTVKTLRKYSDQSRIASKQTNKKSQRHTNWEMFRQKNILEEQKDLLTNRRTSRLSVDTQTEREVHKK